MRKGVLLISPRSGAASELLRIVNEAAIPIEHAVNLDQARFRLECTSFGVILTEGELPDGTWRDVLDLVRVIARRTPVAVTRPFADGRFWVEALDAGAYDVLSQPFDTREVLRVLGAVLDATDSVTVTA